MPTNQQSKEAENKKTEINNAIEKSVKGVGKLVFLNLFLKMCQIFLNFAVIRAIDPQVYGHIIYFLSLKKLQSMLSEDCFREAYQKRVIKADDKDTKPSDDHVDDWVIKTSAQNLVGSFNLDENRGGSDLPDWMCLGSGLCLSL